MATPWRHSGKGTDEYLLTVVLPDFIPPVKAYLAKWSNSDSTHSIDTHY